MYSNAKFCYLKISHPIYRGGGGLTSIDPFCYMKTSHTRGLNNSELNFYYRIVFKRLRQHPLTTKLVTGALLAYADKGMMTAEDLPHFVTGQHDRVGSLAFFRSKNSIFTCLFYLWLSLVGLILAFLSSGRNGFFRYRFLYNSIRNSKEEI